jgi:hypothetical protein
MGLWFAAFGITLMIMCLLAVIVFALCDIINGIIHDCGWKGLFMIIAFIIIVIIGTIICHNDLVVEVAKGV